MQIIELITENPFIIIILIGIISSVFSKRKNMQQEQKHAPRRATNKRQQAGQTITRSSSSIGNQSLKPSDNMVSTADEMIKRAERAEEKKRKTEDHDNPIKKGSVEQGDLTKKNVLLEPKRDQILQGFIWAEVLSPPKSKRKNNI